MALEVVLVSACRESVYCRAVGTFLVPNNEGNVIVLNSHRSSFPLPIVETERLLIWDNYFLLVSGPPLFGM